MEIYLDNAATTRCYDEVRDVVVRTMTEDYGNPSSMHRKGVEAEGYLREAARTLADILKAKEKEIYFTSGGTESNNWALYGAALAGRRRGNHIVTSAIEHAAVAAPLAALEEQGFAVTRLPVSREGLVDPEELERAVTEQTVLVSVMFVNNEIGSVEPIQELGERIKRKNPETVFHVDAIQAFGKYRIHPGKMKIDLLSASGHKIHGPKGVGLLYAGEKVKFRPMILGGGQQNGMRSGTDNVPGIAGMAAAARKIYGSLEENRAHMYRVKKKLAEGLAQMDNVVIHGMAIEEGAPHILNASFPGVRSEVLLHALEDKGIYVSAGSACSSHKRSVSATLSAIGCSRAELESAVRFSFCEYTSEEEIEETLRALHALLPMLRKFTRR